MKDNTDFESGVHSPHFRTPVNFRPLLAGDCFGGGVVKEWVALKRDSNVPHMPFWAYLQLPSYLDGSTKKTKFCRSPTALESICLEGARCVKPTSQADAWLQNSEHSVANELRVRWSRELHMEISTKQWRYACILTHKCSISTTMQETAYKIMTH